MNIVINRMLESDLPRVMKIERKSFADPWSLNSFRRELNDNPYALYLSAYLDEKLIAYIGGWLVTDELHITNLAVDPAYRRQGVAGKLLAELIDLAKKQGIVRATLEVRASNTSAIKLYEKNGFSSVGCRPRYYRNNNEDALIMWKELSNE